MAAGIASGGVRMVLGWLRFGRGTLEPEAVEGAEAMWKVYIEDEIDTEIMSSRQRQWCGAWLWERNCPLGEQCCNMHPAFHLKLCDASTPHIDKIRPVRCVALQGGGDMVRERIVFVEHALAGVVWGRMFSTSKNEQLIASFLRSQWSHSSAHVYSSCNERVEASSIPETCWHRIAIAAGIRTTLLLHIALGPCFQWGPWMRHMFSSPEVALLEKVDTELNLDAIAADPPDSKGRTQCHSCHHWRGPDKHERCSGCGSLLCRPCATIHICRNSMHFIDTLAGTSICMQQESLGSLFGAAADCAAVARALRTPFSGSQHHSRSMRLTGAPMPIGAAVESGLVARCGDDNSVLRASRILECGSEILCTRFSDALLAVRTSGQLRVVRSGDWKTLLSSPAPLVPHHAIEILEDTSLLISVAPRGLNVLNLEDGKTVLVKTDGGEWQLQSMHDQLLTAQHENVTLRDVGNSSLPVVSDWLCNPLALTNTGAIVVSAAAGSTSAQNLLWLDTRQKDLSILPLNCSTVVKDRLQWTAAAVASSSQAPLAVLGSSSGDIVAVELRQSKSPLWCIKAASHGSVRNICLSSRLILAEIPHQQVMMESGTTSVDALVQRRVQATSLHGLPLALFSGLQSLAIGSSSSRPGPGLLACGMGSTLVIVGAPPAGQVGAKASADGIGKKKGCSRDGPLKKDRTHGHTRRNRPQ